MTLRWNEDQYADFLQKRSAASAPGAVPPAEKPKRSREGNHKITVDGETFDSKWEYARWQQLQMMERAGEITNLSRQVEFVLAPSVIIKDRKRPPLRYFLDFQYQRGGETVYEDAKGKDGATDTYRIKRHLMKSVHNIDISEVRKK